MAQYDVNLREYWRILKKRKFTVTLTAIALAVFSTIFAVVKAPIPLYSAECAIRYEKHSTIGDLLSRTFSWSSGGDIETLISVLESYSVMEKVAQRMKLIPEASPQEESLKMNPDVAARIHNLQSKVEISRKEYTNIINIKVTDNNPSFAQKLANTIALTYKDIHSEQQNKKNKGALRFINERLKSVSQKLREAENQFNKFTKKNQLVSIDLQSENLLSRAREIRAEIRKLKEAQTNLKVQQQRLKQFVENPSGSGNEFYSPHANEQYKAVHTNLVELLLKRDSLLKDFTPRHPEVIALKRKIVETARKMIFILDTQEGQISNNINDLKGELAEVNKKTNQLMEKKLKYNRLQRKVNSYNEMVALLERKKQEALVSKADKPEEISIVKPALLPSSPINPPKTVATGAMGVVIGLILGMVFAFIAETFDTSIGAIEDVEETLGTRVLGVIPQEEMRSVEQDPTSSSFTRKIHLVSHFAPQSMVAESFRTLRTNIQFQEVEARTKTIAVTSASPQEGKSMVASNLAVTMAQAGTKTLVVGSDFRKPQLARIFGVENAPGLSDVLLGNYSWHETVKTVTDLIVGKMGLDEVMASPGLDNLHIITTGTIPPNPAELIESKRMLGFIEEVRGQYDRIIFDTPLSFPQPTLLFWEPL